MTKPSFKIKRRNAAVGGGGATTLNTLALVSTTPVTGQAGSTLILGAAPGSTLTLTNTVGGVYSIDSATRTLSWSSSVATGTDHPVIRETLSGATNTPHDTTLNMTVSAGLTITDASGASPYTLLPPVYRDAYVVMTPVVAAGDEAVDVQAVIGAPYSPTAATVTFTGTDLQWFDKVAGGKLIFKASTRAGVPRDQYLVLSVVASNAHGASEAATLWVWVPADNDCVFISYANGNDSSPGDGSLAHPYKHCPGTVDWTGPNITPYSTGKTMVFEGGTRHETSLTSHNSLFYAPPHHGDATTHKPQRYAFHSWKGQAKFSGAVSIPGSWTAATSGDVFGNSNYPNITKVTVSTAIERYQGIFWGETRGFMAQYPRPIDLRRNEDPFAVENNSANYNDTLGVSDGGMKPIFLTTNSSDTTPVRFYLPSVSGGSNAYIQDAKLDVRFNNQSVAYNANGVGLWVKLHFDGNNLGYVRVLAYDVTTHRMTFDSPAIKVIGSTTAYALLNSPYDVQVEGQYALSADGLTVFGHAPASGGQAYVSRLRVGSGLGHSNDVAYHQAWFERYSGSQDTRADPELPFAKGGQAFYAYNTGGGSYVSVYGCRAHQNLSEDEDPVGLYHYGFSSGFTQPIFDRFHYTDNQRGGGSKSAAPIHGVTTGSGPGGFPTMAEVFANARGKVRWWFYDEGGATRTLWYWNLNRGLEFRENVARNFNTVHGDGYAFYRDNDNNASTQPYTDHCVIYRDLADNVNRWMTTSDGDPQVDLSVSRNNWIIQCVALSWHPPSGNSGLSLYSGHPGLLIQQSIMVQSPTNYTPGDATPCLEMRQGFANFTVKNSILNGVSAVTTPSSGVPATWTFDTVGFTGDSMLGTTSTTILTDDAANSRRVLSCSRLTTAQTWDGVTGGAIPSAWSSYLQAGAAAGATRLGPFWTV